MGGAKKPTAASKDRATSRDSKKGKKDKESGPKKAEITVRIDERQSMKIIQNAKVVTVQELARQTGVKISTANAFLREQVGNGTVKIVGGYSGHRLYQAASS